jgi:RecA-family ATPase
MQTTNSTPSQYAHIHSNEAPLTDQDYWQQTRVMVFPGQYFTLKGQPEKHYDSISMSEILSLVRDPANTSKEDAPATIGSSYDEHDARTHDVQAEKGQYSLLRFDIDAGNPSLQDVCAAFHQSLCGGAFMVYSTSSATPDSRRWRVLVPLLVPVNHELRKATEVTVRQGIEMLWGIEFDPVLDRAGQHIYLPAVAPHKRSKDDAPNYYEWEIRGETPLNLEHSTLYPLVQNQINQSRYQELHRQADLEEQRKKQLLKRAKMSKNGQTTLSPIDWFNDQHPLEVILVEAGYEQNPSDTRDWRSPLQTTGSYATRAYDDYFVTLSGSDAKAGIGIPTRNGACVGDAFSLFLYFTHKGDRNSALQEIRARRDFAEESAASNRSNVGLLPIKPITLEELQQASLTPRVVVPDMLYADARLRIGPGGSSKTTLAVHEAVVLALGWPVWGRTVMSPVKTVFITREDSREILVARIRSTMLDLMLDEPQQAAVLVNIAVLDFTDISFRLSAVKDDVVIPHRKNLRCLIDILREWGPDWVICDPLVSFGVGESRVNDAEQGLIEAFRVLRNELNCCIEGIHHTGKAVARDKTLDQYAGRGGSALADGARMVAVMQPLTAKEWAKSTGTLLAEGETGLVMAFPKLSYCKPQPPIFIRRKGFAFRMDESVAPRDPDAALRGNANRVHEFLHKAYAEGQRYSMSELETIAERMHLTRAVLREACSFLKTEGLVIYHGSRGRMGAHYEPLDIDRSGENCLTK